ncbi:nucleoside diphosphate kinase regulator [Stigmatella sp. ncwal1]|uniref:Nucleoside diphosphate kinase regulator n=1 Tax=Stigmatella ashevillensis TaxID=2995309 RepID=A0ABT5D837_9BACT|nr:nucleoside diphosphate kinase regulator [Stigmatella ashevillena]MDC0709008.1 nucleoside diphosphate kinase regulator [Stigmatella ashevillena]
MISRSVHAPRSAATVPALQITTEDMTRLRAVVERHLEGSKAAAAEQLELELERARVVQPEQIPPNVVTMRSRILFEDLETGRRREASLVYPEEANIDQSRVSILAPVGLAVLGLQVGDIIEWPLPNARLGKFRILEVLYQPEAAGDFHL